jgi:hypothetical protein
MLNGHSELSNNILRILYSLLSSFSNASLDSAVSHTPRFEDANTSLPGDAVSPVGDVDVSAGDAHL